MADSVILDEGDRRVLHALQLDGRASFTRIAAVLGMPERAVARRYHRLRARMALRVVGVTRPDPRGQADWFLRVAGKSESIDAVARTLAGRGDTSWIASLAGDGGLGGILRTPLSTRDRGDTLERLRRSAGAVSVAAQRLLVPVAGVGGWPGRLESLTAAEREALTPAVRKGTADSVVMGRPCDDDARRLLGLLAVDGRMSVARLARACGIPESTVRRRIAELVGGGTLMFEVEVDSRLYGRHLGVICRLDVHPAALGDVASALGSHPEVAFAATTTGVTNILAFLELADGAHLHRYLTERIGALPGVHRAETEIVAQWIKRAGPLVALRA
ncbi:hypothetical protein SUDANB105_00524 [Streptomyces sp. enrichment culture]|uniref:Lrp/AsnC family transcriptional regulator n=1 Tax=Streptomyces sp. enrichment culture TaxID=1795815 RepID=UPI003F54D13C